MSLPVGLLFFAGCLLGVPLAFAFGLAGLVGVWMMNLPIEVMASKMMFSINSFPLLAIPFFMFAGELMVRGGIVRIAIDFANTILGRTSGGLGHVTVASGLGLASVSGAALADSAALGSALMKPLQKSYSEPFGAALIAATGNLGPVLPPSTTMILYATIAGPTLSLPGLFIAGVLPALLIALLMSAYIYLAARRRGYPLTGEPFRWSAVAGAGARALPVLLLPVAVIGGIIGGAFTATEGGAIAVLMALLLGLFYTRELNLTSIGEAMLHAGLTTGIVTIIIAFASTVTFIFSIDHLPTDIRGLMEALTTNATLFLLMVMAMLIVIGMFMETTAAYVMLVPIFAPMALTYGIDPLHFALVFILTLIVGMLTPPVGALLFLMSGISGLKVGAIAREVWPYIVIQLGVALAALFLPQVFLFLPRLAGF
ncbi:TRAP transporter large permease [Allosediminivita pacifica]|uniref:TRAP transporter large permease protein n=1 Tax=Allosediminivita pacifica TaxID=1267769 RepID=A0A2T6ATR0_9RHOB|nr:TRAP transporter large permease [Allosediminivita pacifica]PTX47203.1 tripartite ATP-independent transporter DctM subunit [Allosediminivita pacifica]GGB09449.1 C4-dicarboxylate ABC transporter permease [Allosediminivita pacifica]